MKQSIKLDSEIQEEQKTFRKETLRDDEVSQSNINRK